MLIQDPIPGSQFWTSSGGTCEAKEVGGKCSELVDVGAGGFPKTPP